MKKKTAPKKTKVPKKKDSGLRRFAKSVNKRFGC